MRSRPAFTFLLLLGTCFSTSAWAEAQINLEGEAEVTVNETVTLSGTKNFLQSDGFNFEALVETGASITTEDGSGFYLNGKGTMTDVVIANKGTVAVTGKGWGLYANPYQTISTRVDLANSGTFERIQMAETDESTIVNTTGGKILGSVLFGTNGSISNYGTFANKTEDTPINDIANLVSLEKNSTLVNGLLISYDADGNVDGASYFANAAINTDHVQFTNAGALVNSGQVDNKTITMLNDGKIYNVANPYDVTNAGGLNESGPTINTESLTMGDDALIQGDQGTNIIVGTMDLGDGATIKLGDAYLLSYEQTVTIKSTETDDNGTSTETETTKTSNTVPKLATMTAVTGRIGNDASVELMNGAQYAGQTLTLGDTGTITAVGGKIMLFNDDELAIDTSVTPTLAFGDAGTLDISSLYRQSVIIDNISEGTSTETTVGTSTSTSVTGDPVAEEQTVDDVLLRGQLITDNLKFQDNGTINLTGGGISAKRIDFGDYGTIAGEYYEFSGPASGVSIDIGSGVIEPGKSDDDDDDESGESGSGSGGGGSGSGSGSGGSTGSVDNTQENRDKIAQSLSSYPAFSSMTPAEKNAVIDSLITAYNGGGTTTAYANLRNLLEQSSAFTDVLTPEGQQQMVENLFGSIRTGLLDSASVASHQTYATETTIEEMADYVISSDIVATESINFGDYGKITAGDGLNITAPLATFGDNGTIENRGNFNVDRLEMGENSSIQTYSDMNSFVVVGSHSIAELLSDTVEGCDGFGECRGGAIIGGFVKADGAEDVEIVSATDYGHYGYLGNRIIVDKITVQQNMLNLDDVEVNGDIEIGTDAWLRLSGDKALIYDPIRRVTDATNTTIEISLDDNVFFRTRNSVEADHVIVSGGGFEITRPIDVGDIQLDSNTTVRVTGNFATGDLTELDGNAVNTTFAVDAGTGNYVNSSGKIALDRIVVESGIFNAYHEIVALNQSNVVSDIDGIELGTDTVINVYNSAETGRIVRQQNVLAANGNVTNTTMNVNGGSVLVHKSGDLDTLTLDRGRFVFLNQQDDNAVNVTNDLNVGVGSVLAGAGVLNVKSGNLTIDSGGHLGVSVKDVADQALTNLIITKQSESLFDTTDMMQTNAANTVINYGGFLDVRASGANNDVIDVDGTLTLNDGTRLIVRNPDMNTKYDVATADTLVGSADNIRHSFLWKNTVISTDNNTLSVTIGDVQSLREGIADTEHSKNVDAIADALTEIRDQVGHYAVEDFLDNIFYADRASEAIDYMNEYLPEGYLNTQSAALRTMQGFRRGAMDALDNMRSSPDTRRKLVRRGTSYQTKRPEPRVRPVRRVMERRRVVPGRNVFNYTPRSYNPNARSGYNGQTMYHNAYAPVSYGRSGGDSYRKYVQRRPQMNQRKRLRTDRGGIWMNPFVSRVTQDAKDSMQGYDYDSYGLTFGGDRKFGATSFGITGMVAEGELKQTGFKSDITTYGLGLYGSYQPRSTARFIDFYALWAVNANKGTRQISSLADTMKADYDVTTTAIGLSVGYDIPVGSNVTLTPRVGIDYTKVSADDIEETGDSPLLIQMTPEDFVSIKTPVELKMLMKFGDSYNYIMPEFHARWAHEFGDTAPQAQALFTNYQVPFGVSGLEVDSDSFTLGGSLSWLTGASELSLRYDYDFSSSLSGHTLNAGYKYIF